MKEIIGMTAVFLSIIGLVPYFFDVLKGKTKPHLFSWIIWTSTTILVFIAQVQKGAGAGAWNTGVTGFLCTLITLATIKYGSKYITLLDKYLFAVSAFSIIPWILTNDPTFSVILLTGVNTAGAVMTFRKTFNHPGTESLLIYVASSIRHCLSLLAIANLNLSTYLFPSALLVANLAMIILILWQNYSSRKA